MQNNNFKKMKILFVSHRFLRHSLGGTEVMTNDLAIEFSKRGHNIYWLSVCPESNNDTNDMLTFFNNNITEYQVPSIFSKDYPVQWKSQEKKMKDIIETIFLTNHLEIPSIIHILHFSRIGLEFLNLSFFRKCPVVMTCTDYTCICPDYQLYQFKNHKICSPYASAFDCLNCLDIKKKEVAIEVNSWKHRNIHYINNRVNALYFQTPKQKSIFIQAQIHNEKILSDRAVYRIPDEWSFKEHKFSNFRFVYFGRLSAEKGLDIVLENFRRLNISCNATLDIYGIADANHIYIKNIVSKIEGCPGVTLHNAIAHTEVGDVLQTFDCVLIPSIWLENHPIILSYSLALGIPVICSDVPSLTHLAGHKGIYFAKTGSPSSWHKVMKTIIENRSSYKRSPQTLINYRNMYTDFVNRLERTYFNLL